MISVTFINLIYFLVLLAHATSQGSENTCLPNEKYYGNMPHAGKKDEQKILGCVFITLLRI